MKNAFVNGSLNYLKNHDACDKNKEKIFKYTLESLYSFFTKSFVILLLSLFLNTFKITLIILILYSILRGFSFGIHATKNIYCWIISLLTYVILPLFIKAVTMPSLFIYSSYLLGLIAIILWAPADTKARPLLDKNKRTANKIITLFISLIFIIISNLINSQTLIEITAIILLMNLVCTCPLTYYLFKQPYNNYLVYKKN